MSWFANGAHSRLFAHRLCFLDRLREAIECLKRALIGADPHEIAIRTRLASLYTSLGDFAEAANYHKYIVDTSVADSAYLSYRVGASA